MEVEGEDGQVVSQAEGKAVIEYEANSDEVVLRRLADAPCDVELRVRRMLVSRRWLLRPECHPQRLGAFFAKALRRGELQDSTCGDRCRVFRTRRALPAHRRSSDERREGLRSWRTTLSMPWSTGATASSAGPWSPGGCPRWRSDCASAA